MAGHVLLGTPRSPGRSPRRAAHTEAAAQAIPDEENPRALLHPDPDVFSYSMLAAPGQRKKYNSFTCDAAMSYLLVVLVLLIQGVLLFCVYDKVVVSNSKWQNSIMRADNDFSLFQELGAECEPGRSLCLVSNDTYSCAPPSVQLTGRWDELDADGDGIWTMEEALAQRKEVKCKYVVDPVEIFNVFQQMLLLRENIIWIHPDLRAAKAIHKAYFTYAMGDVAMCGYRNQDMCNNLLKRGVFHAALKYGTAPRVGTSVESALDYCRQLLQPMGFCEKLLPSTYATWKIESISQCQAPVYTDFVYKNPGNGVKKSLLEVDYKARQKFETAQTPIFQIYKAAICGIWILLIVSQLREVWKALQWACEIYIPDEVGDADPDPQSTPRSTEGMTWRHKIFMVAVSLTRIVMLFILMYVGLSFLGKSTDYIGLLMDGVALVFIIEVQEIVYAKLIRSEVRAEFDTNEPLTFRKHGHPFLDKRPDYADMLWLFVIIAMSIIFIRYITISVVNPLVDALDCACRSNGEKCFEAQKFSKSFWDHYWRYDVPEVLDKINVVLKQSASSFTAWSHGGLHRPHVEQWSMLIHGAAP